MADMTIVNDDRDNDEASLMTRMYLLDCKINAVIDFLHNVGPKPPLVMVDGDEVLDKHFSIRETKFGDDSKFEKYIDEDDGPGCS